jgi:hypothetical protein
MSTWSCNGAPDRPDGVIDLSSFDAYRGSRGWELAGLGRVADLPPAGDVVGAGVAAAQDGSTWRHSHQSGRAGGYSVWSPSNSRRQRPHADGYQWGMTDAEPRDDDAASNAEREGIVDQQDAALSAIDQADAADEDPMGGEAPTG